MRTMSVYEKFIESAAQTNTSPSKHKTAQHILKSLKNTSTMMIKQQVALPINLPMLSAASINSSTPISKQQYKRLVESNYATFNPSASQQQETTYSRAERSKCEQQLESIFKTNDPVLLRWLKDMRFEIEVECVSIMRAKTLAIDEYSAGALSIRDSQVSIQNMRVESNFILDFVDYLIESLPLNYSNIDKHSIEFSELWTRVVNQTAAQTAASNSTTLRDNQMNNFTIFNCTPRKSRAVVKTLRPLDELAQRIRNLCISYANLLYSYQEDSSIQIDNGQLEASLRKLKELYGKFVEISIRAECSNIVAALRYDFSQTSLNRLSSSSSVHPVRPFESSSSQLPLKWALIALWQLTKDDSYICRTLTEGWQKHNTCNSVNRVAKRLDYSTKYDSNSLSSQSTSDNENHQTSIRYSDYQKLYQLCQNNAENISTPNQGALSNALKFKQQQPIKQVSTIELLIDIIISQPNKHERLDMMNFIHSEAQNNRLLDIEEWDQSVSAAIYTSNQYKVAALRILNQLCVNEQAIKTILKCFSTPPPTQGQPIPENKIIRSIFECYQTSQEHIYQNETMFHTLRGNSQRGRKRSRQVQQLEDDECSSDYGSRRTVSVSCTNEELDASSDEGDDQVVKEAICLIIQLTNPFHRSKQGHDFYTLIGRFSIDSLVKYLTNIVQSTTSREMLFISLTALANISFITTEPMKTYATIRVMLEMFRSSKVRSKDLELRDQAVTILANTADKNIFDIISNGGLSFLLSCLESCPVKMSKYRQQTDGFQKGEEDSISRLNIENKPRDRKPIDLSEDNFRDILDCACDQQQSTQMLTSQCLSRLTQNELAALERIHQKTAVAFARMSVDSCTTRMVLKYGGIKQMIDLCKFGRKRNYSDTVLIACIVALRKMAKTIDYETFKYYNALDLIELELNQTLEIYGNQNLFSSEV